MNPFILTIYSKNDIAMNSALSSSIFGGLDGLSKNEAILIGSDPALVRARIFKARPITSRNGSKIPEHKHTNKQ